MNPLINPTLIEDIQSAIGKYSKDYAWKIYSAEDETNRYKNLFSKFGEISINEIRNLYYYVQLPHDLHATIKEEWNDMDINLDEIINIPKQKSSKSNQLMKQSINLYICDRPPIIERDFIELGMRILYIKWSILFRSIPFGISEIKLSIHNASLENSERLPLILKIIEEVSKVPCIQDHT